MIVADVLEVENEVLGVEDESLGLMIKFWRLKRKLFWG